MKLQPRGLNPALAVLLAEGFLSRLSFGIISFALPLYAYRRLGLSLTETGLLFSLQLVTEQAFKPLMGWVADRCGLKLSFTTAIAVRSLVALLLVFAGSPWQVYLIRLLHGLSESLRDPSINALIAEHSDARTLGTSFAWYSTAKAVAGSIGKAAGGILLTLTGDGYATVFLIAFTLSILPLYVVARYLREPDHHHPMTSAEPGAGRSGGRALFPVALLGFLLAATAHMVHHLFPVLATEYGGLSVTQTSLIYGISVGVMLFAGPLFGWLSDHVSHKLVLMVRGVANTTSSLLYLFAPTWTGFMAGNVIDGLGKAAFRPAWGALMARVSSLDRPRRARTMGYLSLGEGLGETIGPLLGGFLWSTRGITVMLGSRVLLAAITEIYTFIATRPLERRGDAEAPPPLAAESRVN
jgi:MFS family permease